MSYTFKELSLRKFTLGSLFLISVFSASAFADEPGRGATADLEREYLEFLIDHHFSGLRMTELAAGTLEEIPTGEITPDDRTRPTPGFPASEPRAALEEIKSLARRNNRVQREEILTAQRYLRDWYGVTHEPQVLETASADIDRLTDASGDEFDRMFLEIFSRHHYQVVAPTSECLAGRELQHDDLKRFCHIAIEMHFADLDEMRHLACQHFELCDLQPQNPAMDQDDDQDGDGMPDSDGDTMPDSDDEGTTDEDTTPDSGAG